MRAEDYAATYGPSVGDRIRLGDTGLIVEVTADDSLRGDEFLIGFGKTARDGMHLIAQPPSATCDLVVSNVVLMDPVVGIRKTSIGISGGRVVAIGRAGNPNTLDGVDIVVGTGTAVVNGEGLIATPGGIVDAHPPQRPVFLAQDGRHPRAQLGVQDPRGQQVDVGVDAPRRRDQAFTVDHCGPCPS